MLDSCGRRPGQRGHTGRLCGKLLIVPSTVLRSLSHALDSGAALGGKVPPHAPCVWCCRHLQARGLHMRRVYSSRQRHKPTTKDRPRLFLMSQLAKLSMWAPAAGSSMYGSICTCTCSSKYCVYGCIYMFMSSASTGLKVHQKGENMLR
jgi:hypothetical protein